MLKSFIRSPDMDGVSQRSDTCRAERSANHASSASNRVYVDS